MIFDFFFQAAAASGINLAGILHGEQDLIFHNPMPTEGTLITTGRIVDHYDKGADKGALIVAKSDTVLANGQKLFTSTITIFGRLDGGFGGKDRKKHPVAFPDREPDFIVAASPSPDQPLLYRLSGDIFHLHVDPEFARVSGFDMPIMHGLCTHGFACRALIACLVPGRPELVAMTEPVDVKPRSARSGANCSNSGRPGTREAIRARQANPWVHSPCMMGMSNPDILANSGSTCRWKMSPESR